MEHEAMRIGRELFNSPSRRYDALPFLRKASRKGYTDAYCYMGLIFEDLKDFELAKEQYVMGVQNENVWAMNNLASLVLTHKLGDVNAALQLYRQAANRGNALAMNNLGEIYQRGLYEIEQDLSFAEGCYLRAISEDDTPALYNLGRLYIESFPEKKEEGLKSIQQAAFRGYPPAQRIIAKLQELSNPEDTSMPKSDT
eukprot:TRINITY_DN22213_c0_g1_i1.p1 TRINITY_DN22213_c0_g1~~TRINITY_DN22213_c0_g1_i1.p1  ORF type:complete len:198 (+),score=27.22 TRINITY_DN22213_c0_g1_i1:33-626(+)